jgi:hypothetical protein
VGFHDSVYDPQQMRELLACSAAQVSQPHSRLTLQTAAPEWTESTRQETYGPLGLLRRTVPIRESGETHKPVNVIGQGWIVAIMGRVWGEPPLIDSRSYVALVLRASGALEEVSWEHRSDSNCIQAAPTVRPGLADVYDPRLAAFRMDFAEAVSGFDTFHRPSDAMFLERDFTRPIVAAKGEGLRRALTALLDQ